jgi:hypothetical protein
VQKHCQREMVRTDAACTIGCLLAHEGTHRCLSWPESAPEPPHTLFATPNRGHSAKDTAPLTASHCLPVDLCVHCAQASDWLKWGTDVSSYAKNAVQNATTLVAGSDLEKKLAEATSNEPWGASGVKEPCL